MVSLPYTEVFLMESAKQKSQCGNGYSQCSKYCFELLFDFWKLGISTA